MLHKSICKSTSSEVHLGVQVVDSDHSQKKMDEQASFLKASIQKAHEHIAGKDWRSAEYSARKALSIDSSSVLAHDLLFSAILNSEHPEELIEVVHSAIKSCATQPKFARLHFYLAGIPTSEAQKLAEKIYTRWPNGQFSAYWTGTLGETARKKFRRNTAKLPEANTFSSIALRTAVREGKVEALKNLKESLESPNCTVANRAEQVKRMILGLREVSAHHRSLVVDKGEEITQSERGETGTTVLFFSAFGIDQEHTFEVIDSYFAAVGYSSVFLRDFTLNLYLQGLHSLDKTRAETLSRLGKIFEELGTSRLIVAGRSAGGYAALQYGLALKANKIVCFSGPTNLTLQFLDSIEDDRGQLVAKRLNRDNTAKDLNLDNLIGKSKTVLEGIHIHYSKNNVIDERHAKHISSAKNVNLCPVNGYDGHHTFIHYLESGQFLKQISG